jgi:hypothetical protein
VKTGRTKIFGIGLSRTGSTSLADALSNLGWRAEHHPRFRDVLQSADRYDAIVDTPVLAHMQELDCRHQDAKFILTVRDEDAWIRSCQWWWQTHPATAGNRPNRVANYGTDQFDEKHFRRVYRSHAARVAAYFADRQDKLLTLAICDGEGYEKLCPFLGVETLDEPFPQRNSRSQIEEAASRLGMTRLAAGYTKALTRWAAAGFPTRDQRTIAELHARHCRPCPQFHADSSGSSGASGGRCGKCGCNVNRDGWAVRNKLRMATEHCPLGKW